MPKAHGDAKISMDRNRVNIEVSLKTLDPADLLGPRYFTYFGWALTADGGLQNLESPLETGLLIHL